MAQSSRGLADVPTSSFTINASGPGVGLPCSLSSSVRGRFGSWQSVNSEASNAGAGVFLARGGLSSGMRNPKRDMRQRPRVRGRNQASPALPTLRCTIASTFRSQGKSSFEISRRRSRSVQSVSQLFHGPAPRSPLHRLAVRLRYSRSNTSTEYSLPGVTQLSQVRSVSPDRGHSSTHSSTVSPDGSAPLGQHKYSTEYSLARSTHTM